MTRRKRCSQCGRLGCEYTLDTTRYMAFTLTFDVHHDNTPKAFISWRAECNECGQSVVSLDRVNGDMQATLPVLVHIENTHAA